MSLVRAILITAWCLTVAGFHALVLWMIISPLAGDLSRMTDVHPLLAVSFVASVASIVAAIVSIIVVKALWLVMAAAALLLAGGVLAFLLLGFQAAANLIIVALVQLVMSWFIMVLNSIDNPPRPAPNPSEVF